MLSRYTYLIFLKNLSEGKTIAFTIPVPPLQSYREYTVFVTGKPPSFFYSVITEGDEDLFFTAIFGLDFF